MLSLTLWLLLVTSTHCGDFLKQHGGGGSTNPAPGVGVEDDDDAKNWWKKATIYQIYPRSFKDSNGDGVGDLRGIESKLDYISYMGAGAAWLSPIYESPMKDFGYDITNYTSVDPLFGNMEDFDRLVAGMKAKGLKIIMDFVPNHTSNTSTWFQKSVKKQDPYTDYYVWVDGKGENKRELPNNWLGMFGGPAWEWNEERQQFYYHQFIPSQPDLNHRNPKVREELKKVLQFWLDRGVNGFRIDAVKHLFEDPQLRNEPPSNDPTSKPGEYNSLLHIYTTSDPQVLTEMYEWREVLDSYERKDGQHRIMMVEINETIPNTVAYYGNESKPLADIPFNFELFKISKTSTVKDIYGYIKGWLDGVPKIFVPNWIIGNHDQPRIANRTDGRMIDAYNMINLLLRGLPLTYYGEEIGMVDTFVTWEQTRDPPGLFYGPVNKLHVEPRYNESSNTCLASRERYTKFSRDPERTPMQWSKQEHAGFTDGKSTWLPVNPNYKTGINVESEKKDPRSHLYTYKRLQNMRKTPAGKIGEVQFPLVTDSILSFTRTLPKEPEKKNGFVVIINFGDKTETVDLTGKTEVKGFSFPHEGQVAAFSDGIPDNTPLSKDNGPVNMAKIQLPAKQAVAVWFSPKKV